MPTSRRPPTRPPFVPAGAVFEDLPQDVRTALTEVINPLYEELVLRAETPLQRAAGLSVVHAAWLEVVLQHDLGRDLAAVLADGAGERVADHREAIGRYMLVAAMRDKL